MYMSGYACQDDTGWAHAMYKVGSAGTPCTWVGIEVWLVPADHTLYAIGPAGTPCTWVGMHVRLVPAGPTA